MSKKLKWIPIKERPKEYDTVIIYWAYENGNNGYAVGYHVKGEWELDYQGGEFPEENDFKYWMHFPLPPKKEQERTRKIHLRIRDAIYGTIKK